MNSVRASYQQPSLLEYIAFSSQYSSANSEAEVPQAEFVPVQSYTLPHDLHSRSWAYLPASVAESFTPEYSFIPDDFLKPGRVPQPFVGDTEEVRKAVHEAFQLTTGFSFPSDIRISVLGAHDFRKRNSHPHVVGFSLNRKAEGLVSDVIVRADEKDRVLLTIGHEVGHVLTMQLAHRHNEEAKAFAFSRAWMNAIKENDIAGLGRAVVPDNPARNGLHDVACAFVWSQIRNGKDVFALYWELVKGEAGVGML